MKSSKWSLASGQLLEAVEDVLAAVRRVDPLQGEGGEAADRHRADRPERADPDPRRPQQLRIARRGQLADAAVGEHQLDPLDPRGDVGGPRPGPVGAGRDRPGDRLRVDVAKVLQRQPERRQLLVQLGEHGAAADPDQAARRGRRRGRRAARRGRSIVASVIAVSVKE